MAWRPLAAARQAVEVRPLVGIAAKAARGAKCATLDIGVGCEWER